MSAEPPGTDDEIRRAVVDRVRTVQIPGGDPISEQLVEDVAVEAGDVTFVVDFKRLDRGIADRIADQLRGAGLATPGVEHARIEAVDAAAPETGLPVTGVDSLIAVASAKGGVGKTTVTVALARALDAAGLSVGVFDANVHAPDAPDLLGAEGPVRSTPSGSPMPVDADGIQVISVELIADDGPVAWRGAMVHDVVTDLLGNAAWEDRNVLLVDLPPGIGEAVTTLVQRAPLDGGLLVSTPTDAGVRATDRTGALFDAYDVPVVGVVPNMVATEDPLESPYDADGRALADALESVDASATSLEPIPFDPALREPRVLDGSSPSRPGETAVASLAATLESFLADAERTDAPADAVDLRGLPPAASHRQALSEFGVGDDSPVSMLVRGDPDELVDIVEETLARDGRALARTSVEDLGRNGWVVEFEPETDDTTPSPSEPAA